ncbi:TetR/AcrR family transcriptional regulator [Acidimangrovimonas pyrenivorans]|uniref:TetR/AcrR family transcriptional regulator n=1 Tax=Acidimangrovimonas pyrenivorans TaxID=2030798 RepID=A0ABV7ADR1_9RHOB
MTSQPASTSRLPSRQRILAAACEAFAQNSYETVGLREIAARAGVDVAQAHRSFGSKLELFNEAFRSAIRADMEVLRDCDDLAATMAEMLLARRAAVPGKLGAGLSILLHSVASPEAMAALRQVANTEFLDPLRGRRDSGGREGVVLAAAFLAGLGIAFQVLEFDALDGADRETFKRRVVSILRTITAGDTA